MQKYMKKGDRVLVIAGNDKGNSGVILAKKKDRVIVQGINMKKKHMKRKSEEQTSQIIEMECSIHISNVTFCNADGKPMKLEVKTVDGKKELHSSSEGVNQLVRVIKK